MTEYYTIGSKKVEVGWRIPKAIPCKDDCPHCWSIGYKDSNWMPSGCFHPQAQSKRGGWLKECPEEEV